MGSLVGEQFARAMTAKDGERIRELLAPSISFMGMTPSAIRVADTPDGVVDIVNDWFGQGDDVVNLERLDTDSFADRERVGYRVRVITDDGPHLVDQTAYLSLEDGQITWLRIMCAGYRPTDD
ncbi:MAG TPA: hypothetical protein VFX15_15165 [Actinomycetes bacterium]|nr:hypothetical protein [Actinomycetes bacterium]